MKICSVMIYDWHDIKDLGKASIFDLTDDIEIIRNCTFDDEITMEDREEYERKLNDCVRAGVFEQFYTRYLHDEEFLQAVYDAFADHYRGLDTLEPGAFWE